MGTLSIITPKHDTCNTISCLHINSTRRLRENSVQSFIIMLLGWILEQSRDVTVQSRYCDSFYNWPRSWLILVPICCLNLPSGITNSLADFIVLQGLKFIVWQKPTVVHNGPHTVLYQIDNISELRRLGVPPSIATSFDYTFRG